MAWAVSGKTSTASAITLCSLKTQPLDSTGAETVPDIRLVGVVTPVQTDLLVPLDYRQKRMRSDVFVIVTRVLAESHGPLRREDIWKRSNASNTGFDDISQFHPCSTLNEHHLGAF